MAILGNLGSSILASKTKTKKKHFVAQKVKLFRASDPLLSVLMWGVNHSVRARAAARSPSPPPPLPPRSPPPSAAAAAGRGARAGTRPSGCSLSGVVRPPRRLGVPIPAARARLPGSPREPLGPLLDLGPEARRGVPSAFEPGGGDQCRSPSAHSSVGRPVLAAGQLGSLCGARLRLGCHLRRGLLGSESW